MHHVQIRAGGLREKGSRLNRQNLCDLRAGSVVVLRAVSEEPGFRGGGGDVFEILGVEENGQSEGCGPAEDLEELKRTKTLECGHPGDEVGFEAHDPRGQGRHGFREIVAEG